MKDDCEVCHGVGWEVTERGAKRCVCRLFEDPPHQTEQIADKAFAEAVTALGALAFFPTEQRARTVIGEGLARMCPTVDALRYVVRRAVDLYRTWDQCGMPGLRQILCCSKYRPVDGMMITRTEAFPEGVPPESPPMPPALPPGPQRGALPPGMAVSADSKMDAGVRTAAGPIYGPQRRPIRPAGTDKKFREHLDDVLTPPHLRKER
jgi:hypothetical protein